eukprot:2786820-Prymnesium_polylepis.2
MQTGRASGGSTLPRLEPGLSDLHPMTGVRIPVRQNSKHDAQADSNRVGAFDRASRAGQGDCSSSRLRHISRASPFRHAVPPVSGRKLDLRPVAAAHTTQPSRRARLSIHYLVILI